MLSSAYATESGVETLEYPPSILPSSDAGGESVLKVQENVRAAALFESTYKARLARSPIDQAFEGIRDQQDSWDNYTDAFQRESNRLDRAHLNNLQQLNPELLSDANQLNLRLYQQQLESALEEFKWRYHRYPISHMTGIHTGVATVLIRLHRIETVDDANDYIKRLQGVTELFDQLIDGLQARAEKSIIAPQFVYQQAVENSQGIIGGQPFAETGSVDSPLMADFNRKLENLDITGSHKLQLQSRAQDALLQSVGPAYGKLIAVLNDLQSQAKVEGGAWTLPQGRAFYRHALRQTTTTELDAEAIHRLGLAEVERIHGEMKAIIQQADYKGDLSDFFIYMQSAPEFFFPQTAEGKQAYIDEAERLISELRIACQRYLVFYPRRILSLSRWNPLEKLALARHSINRSQRMGRVSGSSISTLMICRHCPNMRYRQLLIMRVSLVTICRWHLLKSWIISRNSDVRPVI